MSPDGNINSKNIYSDMSHTVITHFEEKSYRELYSILGCVETYDICRVPFGRVDDNLRFLADTLPYHFTISSSKAHRDEILSKMSNFHIEPFEIIVEGLDIMRGKCNSYVLYFSIKHCDKMDELRNNVYIRIRNDLYLPQNHVNHLTICIDKDYEKIMNVKNTIEHIFLPFPLTVTGVGIYRIWPGQLISQY